MNENYELMLANLQLLTGIEKVTLKLYGVDAVSAEMLACGMQLDVITNRLEHSLRVAESLKWDQGLDVLGKGFKITANADTGEVSLRKHLLVKDMPYANEHMIDNDAGINESTKVIVEISSVGHLTLDMPEVGYGEEYAQLTSDDALGLLRDSLH
ncbi:hypothetical protein YA0089_26870 [Pseudomonas viridiflava]|uniref:hypothetical protein n=1 Tax=Pseudomonas viridiflava TaxID=33069 RepID=UPI0018E5FB5B|nr:hypothetical protein [Pseudomonas viridiflava]MBI6727242.1 hypothetical protein [Pseudomonas viridiflava]